MKTLLLLLNVLFIGQFFAQNPIVQDAESGRSYFAQCKFDETDKVAFLQLETDLKANPLVKMARFDWFSKKVFVVTKEIYAFSEAEFITLFGTAHVKMKCIQVGVHGRDTIIPLSDCKN
jgi:hypothetical protein